MARAPAGANTRCSEAQAAGQGECNRVKTPCPCSFGRSRRRAGRPSPAGRLASWWPQGVGAGGGHGQAQRHHRGGRESGRPDGTARRWRPGSQVQAGGVGQLHGVELGVEAGGGAGFGVDVEGIGGCRWRRAASAAPAGGYRPRRGAKGTCCGVAGQALAVAEGERAAGLAAAHPHEEALGCWQRAGLPPTPLT